MDDIEEAIERILRRYDDPMRPGVIETPKRAAKALAEMLTPQEFNFTLFDANGYNQMIVEKNVPVFSLCEHHLLPFYGTCSIGYIPRDKIVGISKIARTVDFFARRLNTQEYLTQNIADYIDEKLQPQGVGVVIKAVHLCQVMRGAKARGEMVTSALKGIFLDKDGVKQEFMEFVK